MNALPEDFQVRLTLPRNSAQKKGLSHIIENSSVRDSGLLEDLVSESAKTQNVNIEDPLLRGFRDDLFLSLHGILIRNYDHIIAVRIHPSAQSVLRLIQYHIVEKPALSRP